MASTDIVVHGDDSTFAVLRMEQDELAEIIRESLPAGESIGEFDLPRVKVPAGGGKKWEVPTPSGDETVPEIEGIIIHAPVKRAYWPNRDPDGSPPQCSSPDGIQGYGDPGVLCRECPLSAFGSDDGGRGQACKQFRQLFVLIESSLLPIVVTCPPTSVSPAKKYGVALAGAGLGLSRVTTRLGLVQETNPDGQKYSKVTFAMGRQLDPDAIRAIKKYTESLGPAFAATQLRPEDAE